MIITKSNFKTYGYYLAAIFLILQPIMIQNPLKPILNHGLGSLQIVDLLFPFILIWLGFWISNELRYEKSSKLFALNGLPTLPITVFTIAVIFSGLGAGVGINIANQIKIIYLIFILIFFTLSLSDADSYYKAFRLLVLSTLMLMVIALLGYSFAFISGESNQFAQVKTGFPYLGNVVRLIGPMQPTSKLFGMYLLILSLTIYVGRNKLSSFEFNAFTILAVLCSVLTLGRVGLIAAFSYLVSLLCLSKKRVVFLPFLMTFFFLMAIFIFLITLFHVDIKLLNFACDVPYAIEPQTQYFGWYNNERMCVSDMSANVTFSSYFLLKMTAIKAWFYNPVFGIGISQFQKVWLASAGTDFPRFYIDYPFPMAQSSYLTLLCEIGLLGFLAWGAVVFSYLRNIHAVLKLSSLDNTFFRCWLIFFLYALLDLDVHNFRFFYSLIPFTMGLAGSVSLLKDNN